MTKRNYELMLVLSPELDENGLENLIERIKQFIDNAQAKLLSFKSWGLRRLAYMIQGHRDGRYYLVHFSGESENCSELERNLTLTEGILRHLLTIADTVPTVEVASVAVVTDETEATDVEVLEPEEDTASETDEE